mmetsp:Transcript_48720/g.83195  ORF Transcript_48720/g.83195 Transcript_48720/m.83195 type:complete len:212 (-) Transcript_48720:59-694(-)
MPERQGRCCSCSDVRGDEQRRGGEAKGLGGVHIYSIPAKDLKNMHGAGGHKINAERLLLELPTSMGFEGALPPKPKAPSPYPARKEHAASSVAVKGLDRGHYDRLQLTWKEVLEMTKEGVFTAPKRKRTGGGIGGKKRKKRAVSVAKERTARDNEVALVGAEFEDEGTMWKAVEVEWSDDDNCIAVWYYDLNSAALWSFVELLLASRRMIC